MAGYDAEIVREVSTTVTGLVRAHRVDGAVVYDWVSDNDDSDEWFETADDAERDFINHF